MCSKELQKNKKKSVTIAGEPYFQPENSPVCNFIATLSYTFTYLHADGLADETDVEKPESKFFYNSKSASTSLICLKNNKSR
jgi:hypothetical protein